MDTSFLYFDSHNKVDIFRSLNKFIPNDSPERLLTIKKYPFYQYASGKFVLVDQALLVDKCYNQFINDFWFDKVKNILDKDGNKLFTIRKYRGVIGEFVEQYVSAIFKKMFSKRKHYAVKTTDELKVKTGKKEIELSDIYIRVNKDIFIAEIKSTGIYDEEKFSNDLDGFYKGNRDAFFKSFGIDQLLTAIKNLDEFGPLIDSQYPKQKKVKIYPAIIVNEKAMQTPLMAHIFNSRFNEQIATVKSANKHIFPLSLIHVSDIEQLDGHVSDNPSLFWKILDNHRKNDKFIPPFYQTLSGMGVFATYESIESTLQEIYELYAANGEDENSLHC
jgi:hypothetical protein